MHFSLPEISVDVLIIGSGPAGLSTALHLLMLNQTWADRMLVLEKEAHPRPKLCGGGITRLGLNTLRDLGFSLPLPLPHVSIHDVTLRYGSKTIHVKGNPQIIIYHRPLFDQYLADQSRQRGITLHENEIAQQIILDDNEILVTTTKAIYHTKVLVGADGSNGLSRRLIRSPQSFPRVSRTVEFLQPTDGNNLLFSHHRASFDFSVLSKYTQGYIWDFPTLVNSQAHLNRGVYDARVDPLSPRSNLPNLLKQVYSQSVPSATMTMHGYPIHWFSPFNKFSTKHALLVGDGAGADPLFGEGIAPALAYGGVAARTIAQAFETQDFSFHNYRQNLFTSYLGRYLLIRWMAAQVVYRLGKFNGFSNLLWMVGNGLAHLFPPPPPLPE
ncbi:MAG: FAD-dependent monooxygenase [Anaerolineales bacterium]